MAKVPATPAEREYLTSVRALACICCTKAGIEQTSQTEAHHIKRDPLTGRSLGGSQKAPHFHAIPLCQKLHHWNGVYVSIGSRAFEAEWGNELDLLAETYDLLGLPYIWEQAS